MVALGGSRQELTPDDHVMVVWGATGDLAKRKLLPGLYHLDAAGLMPRRYRIIGASPDPMSDQQFRAHAADAVRRFGERDPSDAAEYLLLDLERKQGLRLRASARLELG